MRILVADDDPVALALLEGILVDVGHEVQVVENGARAWAAFGSADFDVALLDWQMPDMSGVEVCRLIRESARGEMTFVIIVTARDTLADLSGALESGADDYLIKPVVPNLLRARLVIAARRLQDAADRRRTLRELARAQRLAAIGETTVALQHEINNPLSALLANVHLAGMSDNLQEVRDLLGSIGEQGRRIAEFVKRLERLDEPRSVEYVPGSQMLDLSRKGDTEGSANPGRPNDDD